MSDDDTTRTCADVMAVFDWIRCEDDGSFSAFQCNPENRRCFCLQSNGTRASKRVFRQDKVSPSICTQSKEPRLARVELIPRIAIPARLPKNPRTLRSASTQDYTYKRLTRNLVGYCLLELHGLLLALT